MCVMCSTLARQSVDTAVLHWSSLSFRQYLCLLEVNLPFSKHMPLPETCSLTFVYRSHSSAQSKEDVQFSTVKLLLQAVEFIYRSSHI